MRKNVLGIVSLLALLALWTPAHADNPCWSDGPWYSTTAANGHEDSAVVSTVANTHFCQMAVTNNSASTVWAMLFDASALPANNTLPVFEFPVTTVNTTSAYSYPRLMTTGVVVACSSTEGKLTVTVANSCNFEVKTAR